MQFFPKNDQEPINLLLLHWYDKWSAQKKSKDKRNELYGCKRLYKTNQYTCIYLESVMNTVHIIARNNTTNEYLVNNYIF